MAIIGALPYTMTNGTTADATQVMADFNSLVSQVNANAATAGANSGITSLTGLTTPLETQLFGTTAGSATVQTLSVSMPFTSLVGGIVVRAKIGGGLDGTAGYTLNVNGSGAKTVLTVDGSAPAVVAGRVYEHVYDSVAGNWVNLGLTAYPVGTAGAASNLKGAYASTTTATWTACELVVKTALGGTGYLLPSYSQTLNVATTGAGGMDTGSAPTSNWLYVYAIAKADGTQSILGTTSGTGAAIYPGANMPSGYVASALISALRMDGSAHFTTFGQFGTTVCFPGASAVSGGTATSYTSVDISSLVPPPAKWWGGNIYTSGTSTTTSVAGDGSGTGGFSINQSGTVNISAPCGPVPIITAQRLYYSVSAGSSGNVGISSFTF